MSMKDKLFWALVALTVALNHLVHAAAHWRIPCGS